MVDADKDDEGGKTAPGGQLAAAKRSKRVDKAEKRENREKRLAAALRANLRRRKAGGKD